MMWYYGIEGLYRNDRKYQNQRNRMMYHLGGVPFVGDIVRMYDSDRYMGDYLSNRGLDWADIKYPTMTKGASSSVGGMWKTSEKSLKALYDSDVWYMPKHNYSSSFYG